MFWRDFASCSSQYVDADSNKVFSSEELLIEVQRYENLLGSDSKLLVLILCNNSVLSLARYLACLRLGHTVMLYAELTEKDLLRNIIADYSPNWVLGGSLRLEGYETVGVLGNVLNGQVQHKLHKDLAVMLATSGTTGSSKFVKLSYKNLQSNAISIAQYLGLSSFMEVRV